MKITLRIEGMSCGGCVRSVDKALRQVPGVSDVQVDLGAGAAAVEGDDLLPELLTEAVEAAGYEVSIDAL